MTASETLIKAASGLMLLPLVLSGETTQREWPREIVNGRITDEREFPSVVLVVVDSQYYCTGNLVSPDWVLTAAHCLHNENGQRLPVSNIVHGSPHVQQNIAGTFDTRIHPWYDSSFQSAAINDLALIRMPSHFGLPAWPMDIASLHVESLVATNDATVGAVGWGKTCLSRDESCVSDYLRASPGLLKVPQSCSRYTGNSVGDEYFCWLGLYGAHASYGDSGGPLFGETSAGLRVQIGVASRVFSYGSHDQHIANLYTRIGPHYEWISNTTLGFTPPREAVTPTSNIEITVRNDGDLACHVELFSRVKSPFDRQFQNHESEHTYYSLLDVDDTGLDSV